MLLQLQAYDLILTHIPGKDIPIADTMSKKFLSETYPQLSAGMDLLVHMVVSNNRMSSRRMDAIKTATQADPQIKVMMQLVHDGWPESWKLSPKQALEYWNHIDEFTKIVGRELKELKESSRHFGLAKDVRKNHKDDIGMRTMPRMEKC